MKKRVTYKKPEVTTAVKAKQSERVMLALTPEEHASLAAYAARMSADVGLDVGVATAARSLVLAALRKMVTP